MPHHRAAKAQDGSFAPRSMHPQSCGSPRCRREMGHGGLLRMGGVLSVGVGLCRLNSCASFDAAPHHCKQDRSRDGGFVLRPSPATVAVCTCRPHGAPAPAPKADICIWRGGEAAEHHASSTGLGLLGCVVQPACREWGMEVTPETVRQVLEPRSARDWLSVDQLAPA